MNNKNIKRFAIARNKSSGFTMIELVLVIVILGILSAVALPKFVDLSKQARASAMQGISAAIGTGSSINFAAKRAGSSAAITIASANVCDINVVGNLLQGGASGFDSSNYVLQPANNGTGDTSCATADSVQCEIRYLSDATIPVQPFTVYCAR